MGLTFEWFLFIFSMIHLQDSGWPLHWNTGFSQSLNSLKATVPSHCFLFVCFCFTNHPLHIYKKKIKKCTYCTIIAVIDYKLTAVVIYSFFVVIYIFTAIKNILIRLKTTSLQNDDFKTINNNNTKTKIINKKNNNNIPHYTSLRSRHDITYSWKHNESYSDCWFKWSL